MVAGGIAAYIPTGIFELMRATPREPTERIGLFALLVGCIAGGFFCLTLCRFGYPIQSAEHVAHGLGLSPFPGIRNAIWNHLLNLAVKLPIGSVSVAVKANLLSMALGAVAVGLLAYVVAALRHNRSPEELGPEARGGAAHLISGFAAAGFLALSTPFWFVSTRANPAALHAVLILLPLVLLIRFQRTSRFYWLLIMAFVYGLGATQYAILYLLLPVYTAYVLVALSRVEILSIRRIAAICITGLLGYSFVAFAAWKFTATNAARWQEMDSFGTALYWFIVDQVLISIKAIPVAVWLLILLLCVVPWVLIVALPLKREAQPVLSLGSVVLHVIITILGSLILLEVFVGPYSVLGSAQLVVFPYVVAAMWFGYLAGYWYLIAAMPGDSESKSEAPVGGGRQRMVVVPVVAFVILLVGAGVRNFSAVNPVYGRAVARVADAIVEELDGCRWVLSNGLFDHSILLAAADRNLKIHVLSPANAHKKPVARYYRSMFEEPQLRAVAEAGLVPLLAEWTALDETLNEKMLTMINPDLWYQAGYSPLPLFATFAGTADASAEGLPDQLKRQLTFWKEIRILLGREESAPAPLRALNRLVRRHVSKIANNAGYALDELTLSEDAEAAYRAAWALDEGNISALANLVSAAADNGAPDAGTLHEALLGVIENPDRRPVYIPIVSHHYGYLRKPRELMERGHLWAASGFPIRGGSDNLAPTGGEGRPLELLDLASADSEEKTVESGAGNAAFLEQLKKDPNDKAALFGLAVTSMRLGDIDLAQSTLLKLEKLGMSPPIVKTQLALIELLKGNRDVCKDMLSGVVEQYPSQQSPACLLLRMALEDENMYSVERLVERLKGFEFKQPMVHLALLSVSSNRPDLVDARRHLEALTGYPRFSLRAFERLIELDLEEKRKNLLRSHVNQLLSIDPENALANLGLGKLQSMRGDFEFAEISLRRSVLSRPTADGLNSLGWVLIQTGKSDEALEMANRSLELTPDDPHVLDTQGVALMHLGRLDEAEASLRRAVDLNPDWAVFHLHLAQVFQQLGKTKLARESVEIQLLRKDLSPRQMKEVMDLRDSLKNAGG